MSIEHGGSGNLEVNYENAEEFGASRAKQIISDLQEKRKALPEGTWSKYTINELVTTTDQDRTWGGAIATHLARELFGKSIDEALGEIEDELKAKPSPEKEIEFRSFPTTLEGFTYVVNQRAADDTDDGRLLRRDLIRISR